MSQMFVGFNTRLNPRISLNGNYSLAKASGDFDGFGGSGLPIIPTICRLKTDAPAVMCGIVSLYRHSNLAVVGTSVQSVRHYEHWSAVQHHDRHGR